MNTQLLERAFVAREDFREQITFCTKGKCHVASILFFFHFEIKIVCCIGRGMKVKF